MRICKRCNKEKEDWAFSFSISRHTGRESVRKTCRECEYIRHKERRKQTGHAEHIKYKFGISEVDFEIMLNKQNSRCAICGSTDPDNNWAKFLVIDHCHKTHRIRGLLCARCNRGLGYFKDSSEILRKAAEYLGDVIMNKWRWEHQGDGRILRLFCDNREVLIIDRTRLRITDEEGMKRLDHVIGKGVHPTFENEQLILKLLNSQGQ